MAILEQPGWRKAAITLAVLAAVAVSGAGAIWLGVSARAAGQQTGAARPVPGETDRVVVEVLNASPAVGLARAATRRLRDAGLDVVYYGSDTTERLDSTEVLLRRGAARSAERVARALGTGRVRAAPDASRLVDVSVRLGRDFARLLRNP